MCGELTQYEQDVRARVDCAAAELSIGCGRPPGPTVNRRRSRAGGTDALIEAVSSTRGHIRRLAQTTPKFPRLRVAAPAAREPRRHRMSTGADHGDRDLRAMALGGMRDHVGGGSSSILRRHGMARSALQRRFSTRQARAYVEAGQAAGNPFFLLAVHEDSPSLRAAQF